MSQTLYCLAAVLVFGTFAFTRQQALAADERAEVQREVEAAALVVAGDWAARVKDAAFDAAPFDASNLAALTPAAAFGPEAGETPAAAFDDADDVHDLDVTVTARAGRGLIAFRVRASVGYADPSTLAPAAGPTAAKRVEIVVAEDTGAATGRPPVVVRLPVLVTPARQALHSGTP